MDAMVEERLSDVSTPCRSAVSLAEFFRDAWPILDFATRLRLTRELAVFLQVAHDRGWRHRRLCAATITVAATAAAGRFAFAAGPSSRLFSGPIGEAGRVEELAGLYAGLLPQCGRAEAVRFLDAYLASSDRSEVRRWLSAVQRLALKKAFARWRLQGRLALGSNREFVREARSGFRIFRRRDSAAEEALAALLPDPDRVLAQGEVMPGRGNSCVAARVRIAGRQYILKRYNCRGWAYRLRHVLRRSRALRTWLAALAFRLRGVPLPEPCLCMEERRWRLLERSYILTEYFAGASRLSDLYPLQSSVRRRALLARLGIVFGRLHRFLGIHGDSNWDNILVRPEGDCFAVALVDLDGSRLPAWRRPARLAKDIWHFVRDMKRKGGDRQSEIDFFLRCWSRWSGWQGRFRFEEEQ
jgi:tRNA A-37 threonylcarbamoyl transferase component Bud32